MFIFAPQNYKKIKEYELEIDEIIPERQIKSYFIYARVQTFGIFMYFCNKIVLIVQTNHNFISSGNMKKILLLFTCAAISLSAFSQDILVRKNGDAENVKVLEVSPAEVKYKKSSNLNGPIFTEKRTDIYSIKYENGEVQSFNTSEKQNLKLSSASSAYNEVKKFNHEIDLFIGNGWGLGYQLRKEFNPYIGWDIAGVSYMTEFKSPGKIGLLNFRLLGVRLFTPAYKTIRGYAGLNLGYSLAYLRDYEYNTYIEGIWVYTDKRTDYLIDHLFGLDFSVGVQVHKNIALGYNLNFITNDGGNTKNHMAKISFIF